MELERISVTEYSLSRKGFCCSSLLGEGRILLQSSLGIGKPWSREGLCYKLSWSGKGFC